MGGSAVGPRLLAVVGGVGVSFSLLRLVIGEHLGLRIRSRFRRAF